MLLKNEINQNEIFSTLFKKKVTRSSFGLSVDHFKGCCVSRVYNSR